MNRLACALLLGLFVPACGETPGTPNPIDNDGSMLDFSGVDGGPLPDGPIPDGPAQGDGPPDTTGPLIEFISPKAGDFIGGNITVHVKITDSTAVDDATVVAVFGGNPAKYSVTMKRVMTTSEFVGLFDAGKLGKSFVFPSLSVRADDTFGNPGEAAIEVIVDNVPPTMSLDPPKVRVRKQVISGTVVELHCTPEFDPVGDESVNDGKADALQLLATKALVEDAGNTAPGQLARYFSGVDPASVQLVAIPAANAPLVVDLDADGVCDDVNPNLIPTLGMASAADQSIQLNMSSVPGPGTPDFGERADTPPTGCTRIGTPGTQSPKVLCPSAGTSLQYIVRNGSDPLPSVWTIPTVTTTPYGCIGLQFDTLNRLEDGPVCMAVRGRDLTGNRGVSKPLRVCLRRMSMAGHPCDTFTPPDCTGTYTAGAATATPCTARTFAANRIYDVD
jgi:hypothetical protein